MQQIGKALVDLHSNLPARGTSATSSQLAPTSGECPKCGGSGWLGFGVPYGDPRFGEKVECPCGLVTARKMARLGVFDCAAGFEPRPGGFATLMRIKGQGNAVKAVAAFCADPHGWLYLHGPNGDGKTLLLSTAIVALRAANRPAVFWNVVDMLDYLKGGFDDEAGEKRVSWEEIKDIDILALDDLGAENPTPWAVERLYGLLNWRYRLRKPTVISSNLEPGELREPRLASRVRDKEFCRPVFCGKEDVRLKER